MSCKISEVHINEFGIEETFFGEIKNGETFFVKNDEKDIEEYHKRVKIREREIIKQRNSGELKRKAEEAIKKVYVDKLPRVCIEYYTSDRTKYNYDYFGNNLITGNYDSYFDRVVFIFKKYLKHINPILEYEDNDITGYIPIGKHIGIGTVFKNIYYKNDAQTIIKAIAYTCPYNLISQMIQTKETILDEEFEKYYNSFLNYTNWDDVLIPTITKNNLLEIFCNCWINHSKWTPDDNFDNSIITIETKDKKIFEIYVFDLLTSWLHFWNKVDDKLKIEMKNCHMNLFDENYKYGLLEKIKVFFKVIKTIRDYNMQNVIFNVGKIIMPVKIKDLEKSHVGGYIHLEDVEKFYLDGEVINNHLLRR